MRSPQRRTQTANALSAGVRLFISQAISMEARLPVTEHRPSSLAIPLKTTWSPGWRMLAVTEARVSPCGVAAHSSKTTSSATTLLQAVAEEPSTSNTEVVPQSFKTSFTTTRPGVEEVQLPSRATLIQELAFRLLSRTIPCSTTPASLPRDTASAF